MYDFIIVGAGLAGVSFANLLQKEAKTFCIINDNSQMASLVSGGVYNPLIFKRFTPVWKAKEQMNLLNSFYSEIEQKVARKLLIKENILKRFASTEDQNNWFLAADKPLLSEYMSTEIRYSSNTNIVAPFGCGKMLGVGRLDVKNYLEQNINQWKAEGLFYQRTFEYEDLDIKTEYIEYQSVTAKNIVFCEGYGIRKNPFFNYLPMKPCKGEILTFYAPDLQLSDILKADGVILPLGDDLYKMGATYHWEDLTDTITEAAKNELILKLENLISCSYEVVAQEAAVRPTVNDRRPLVGHHPKYQNVWILNGLGTRGVMNAPYVATALYNAVYQGVTIEKEMNIDRFSKYFK